MPSPNPRISVDALVLVDISPRWLYGHTREDVIDGDFDGWTRALAQLTRRLHATARFLEEQTPEVPLVAVELTTLTWLRVPRAGATLALGGLYGDACVKQGARQLQTRGHQVVVVSDLCVWEVQPDPSYPAPYVSADKLWPNLPTWVQQNFLQEPIPWDGLPLFTSDLPEL